MRILWLSHFVPYPPIGGALQRSFHLLRHACEQHEVHLLALHQPRLLEAKDLPGSIAALSKLCATVRTFAIPAERTSLRRTMTGVASVAGSEPFDVAWLRSSEMRAAVDAFRGGAIDLVHVDTIGLWPYVADWRHVPIVLGHHNVESELILRRVERESAAWRAALLRRDASKLRDLEAQAVRLAAVNVVVSSLDGERLKMIVPDAAVAVVDNGVDTDYWTPSGSPASGSGIIFAGTLGWYPNRDAVDFLLSNVWPELSKLDGDRRLVLVGRDPPPSALAAAAGDARIHVTGFVPDARPFFHGASIFVCPVRVGGGTRLKILDALATGKPLVSTGLGVEGLDLVEGEHYLRAETGSEFVAQIARLERDPDLRIALGAAGRRLVIERYDWNVIGRQLDAAYARALTVFTPRHAAV